VKRLFHLFVLTTAEQRIIIVVIVLLLAGAWFKHQRDLRHAGPPQSATSPSPASQETAISKSPTP
jgi:hypothetical protein